MLVVNAVRFQKCNRRQRSVGERRIEIRFVFQMLCFRRSPVGIVREIDERLMMKLKERTRMSGKRIVPSAGIPCPAYAFGAEFIADRRECQIRNERRRICRSRM